MRNLLQNQRKLDPADIYLLRVNNRNTRTLERQWRRFGVFIVNFEHISHLYSSVSIVNLEHVIAGWEVPYILELYIIQKYLKLGRYNTYSGIKQCIV